VKLDAAPENLLHLEHTMRRRQFIGRSRELELFCDGLDQSGARIFYVYGPAGIGKTSLLQAFAAEADARALRRDWIDARDLTANIDDVVAALDRGGPPAAGPGGRRIVLFDTYEMVRPIDGLVAREVLRRADDATTIVIAGRQQPSLEWRQLSVWGSRVIPIPLRNLDEEDAIHYLTQRGVAADSCLPIARFSHGHPLALTCAAEAWRTTPGRVFAPDEAPDVVRELYTYLLSGIPEGSHRRALEAAAVLHTSSEAVLTPLVGDTARDWFGWLCSLSFMVLSQRGVFPHDLVREIILAELRWRCPERLMMLTLRAQRLLAARVEAATAEQFPLAFSEFAFALSHNPRARNMRFTVDELWLDSMRPADVPAIEAAVERHEGTAAREQSSMWIAAQPDSFKVARDPRGAVVAFIANLRLDLTTSGQRGRDPIVAAAWADAAARLGAPPTRPIGYGRWIMDIEVHQEPCLSMAVCTQAVGELFFLPDFAFYYVRFDRWERWADAARLCQAALIPALAHTIGDKVFSVTVQDHRGLSGSDWLLRFSEDAAPHEWAAVASASQDVSALSALSRDEFAARVREALRSLTDPLVLARNPLIHSRSVVERCAAGATAQERTAALERLLREAVAAQRGSPRGDRWYRVLHAAYVEPMGKHESIAPLLGHSYSTFRRLLAAATEHIVDALWVREMA